MNGGRDGASSALARRRMRNAAPRGFPDIVATNDVGALMDTSGGGAGSERALIRYRTDWPEFGIDNADVVFLDQIEDQVEVALLETAGTVVVRLDDAFVRTTIDEAGTPGWPGRAEVAPSDGTVTAPGLNDYITVEQPRWADDPTLFGLQIVQSLDANEQLTTQFDEAAGTLTLTVTGLLDDSIAATRHTVVTERADDGLLRFVSGTYSGRCRPDRGHQDFSPEPCV